MIRPYLSDIINDHTTQVEWKVHLTMAINYISSKEDSDESRTMRTKGHKIEVLMGSEIDYRNKLLKNFLNHFCKDIKID